MSMETPTPMPLMSCLSLVDDPRRAGYARRHDLQEILTMAVCAVLCDMNSFEEIAFWAQSKEARAAAATRMASNFWLSAASSVS